MPGLAHIIGCGCTPCTPFAACYRIVDYEDGVTLQIGGACANCQNSSDDPWAGDFPVPVAFPVTGQCRWEVLGRDIQLQSIDGKHLKQRTRGEPDSYIIGKPSAGWSMIIKCGWTFITDEYTIWSGTKGPSASPVGTYTRSAGCDATEQLEIEACP